MPSPLIYGANDHTFRSASYVAAQEARAALAEAEAAVAAAQAIAAEHAAKVAEHEAAEQERLLDVRSKEMRSRVQAGRNRASTIFKLAAQFEVDLAAAGATLAKLRDEAEALNAVLPDSVPKPFPPEVLADLFEIAAYRAGLPVTHLRSETQPFSSEIETLGKNSVEAMSEALGIRPRKATAGEPS
jgi:hypothetical protein